MKRFHRSLLSFYPFNFYLFTFFRYSLFMLIVRPRRWSIFQSDGMVKKVFTLLSFPFYIVLTFFIMLSLFKKCSPSSPSSPLGAPAWPSTPCCTPAGMEADPGFCLKNTNTNTYKLKYQYKYKQIQNQIQCKYE